MVCLWWGCGHGEGFTDFSGKKTYSSCMCGMDSQSVFFSLNAGGRGWGIKILYLCDEIVGKILELYTVCDVSTYEYEFSCTQSMVWPDWRGHNRSSFAPGSRRQTGWICIVLCVYVSASVTF